MSLSKRRDRTTVNIEWEDLRGGEVRNSSFNMKIRGISILSQSIIDNSPRISREEKSREEAEAQSEFLNPEEIKEIVSKRMAAQDEMYYNKEYNGQLTSQWRNYAKKRRL